MTHLTHYIIMMTPAGTDILNAFQKDPSDIYLDAPIAKKQSVPEHATPVNVTMRGDNILLLCQSTQHHMVNKFLQTLEDQQAHPPTTLHERFEALPTALQWVCGIKVPEDGGHDLA